MVDFRVHDELTPISLPKTGKSKGLLALKITTALVVGFFGLFFFVTAPSQIIRLEYAIAQAKNSEPLNIVNVGNQQTSFSQAIVGGLSTDRFFRPINTTSSAGNLSISIDEGELVIPKIGVRAPILWNSTFENTALRKNLENGLAHYEKTALPNAEGGNVFITGHSSDYWWNRGDYKTVFTLLDKLVAGDQAFIKYQGNIYAYAVTDSVVVSPREMDVTNNTVEPTLSLMTCTPIGTAINRLIMRFDLVGVYIE